MHHENEEEDVSPSPAFPSLPPDPSSPHPSPRQDAPLKPCRAVVIMWQRQAAECDMRGVPGAG
ncbi:hypothetical protein E2C01_038095 [Portunus trituberculatus]|uniref:Uncharacterized protein n=1 Tax=Portunus trituberculatus TaxID=210409 RepID=A0A5B7FD91_PORTR|nr:hypothetical protein [Portunus trituberculatus]